VRVPESPLQLPVVVHHFHESFLGPSELYKCAFYHEEFPFYTS
jgi:hypothetical protein